MLTTNALKFLADRHIDAEVADRLGVSSYSEAAGGKISQFLNRLQKNDETECWEWIGYVRADGYGAMQINKKYWYVHRVAYFLFSGDLKDGMEIDHLCRNRRCCNPLHLEQVTHRENGVRGVSPWGENARRTECTHGHPLTGENVRIVDGRRRCRKCAVVATVRYQKKKMEAVSC